MPFLLSTTTLRKKHDLSRKDAVRCNATGQDIAVYKNSEEYKARATRRSKQGNGIDAPSGRNRKSSPRVAPTKHNQEG